MDLAGEFRDLKRKEFLEEKRRQRLRENNQELRELQKHLQTAYFVKSIKDQQDQKLKKQQQQQLQKEKEGLEIETERKRNEETVRQQEIAEQLKKTSFRATLQTQIVESYQRRRVVVEEMAQDREQLDRLMANFKLEENKERKELEERRESMRQDLEDLMQQQEAFKRKQEEKDERDRLRAQEVQRQRDEERKYFEQSKRQERIQQTELSERIGLENHKIELEKQRRENVMLELLEEERKAKEDYRFRECLERQIRAREHVRFELERFIEKRKLEKELEKRNKLSAERYEMQQTIAENEKKSAMEIQCLRDKEKAYNDAIQQLLEERRQQRASGVAEHMRDFALLCTEERRTQQEIEEERMRLLQNHPTEILGYLPPGVLHESDREILALPHMKSDNNK